MSALGSVTAWIDHLRHGEREAIQALWSRYFRRLVSLARERLSGLPRAARAAADEEDVALSAFDSFCRRAEGGQFPQLADRHDLWVVLVLLASRKACDLIEREGRGKRDWRRREDAPAGWAGVGRHLMDLVGREPDPALAMEMAERCAALLLRLDDDQLRRIAVLKFEGHTNVEIARMLGCALATVERRLVLIRESWWAEGGGAGPALGVEEEALRLAAI
jgi:DNA-directed RNA polymerase specialized sigma24 family protein